MACGLTQKACLLHARYLQPFHSLLHRVLLLKVQDFERTENRNRDSPHTSPSPKVFLRHLDVYHIRSHLQINGPHFRESRQDLVFAVRCGLHGSIYFARFRPSLGYHGRLKGLATPPAMGLLWQPSIHDI